MSIRLITLDFQLTFTLKRAMELPSLQPMMLVAGLALLCWIFLRRSIRNRRAHKQVFSSSLQHQDGSSRNCESFEGTGSLGAPPEVLKWQVELHELARELKAELECRIVTVGQLTRSYDMAAKRLSELIRLAEQTELAAHSPLANALRLHHEGWSTEKIAATIGVSQQDVKVMIAISGANRSGPIANPKRDSARY